MSEYQIGFKEFIGNLPPLKLIHCLFDIDFRNGQLCFEHRRMKKKKIAHMGWVAI